MMINLEIPEAIRKAEEQARMLAEHFFRPISRKYDKQEHDYPTELDAFADLRRMGGSGGGKKKEPKPGEVVNGSNMSGVSSIGQLCWGDVGLMMAMPGSGLGNAAIGAAGTPEQKEKYAGCYAAMAITEPGAGSDSKNVSTTATLEGDQWVLNLLVTANGVAISLFGQRLTNPKEKRQLNLSLLRKARLVANSFALRTNSV
jgi:acyl-CoA dehydrogenase